MDIEFSGLGTLKTIAIRKEESEGEKDKEVACSIKIEMDVKARVLQPLVGGKDDPQIENAFWNQDGVQQFFTVKGCEFDMTFKDHRMNIGNELFVNVTLSKFILVPKDEWFASVVFTAHINPNPTQLSRLGDFLTEDVQIKVQGHPQLI